MGPLLEEGHIKTLCNLSGGVDMRLFWGCYSTGDFAGIALFDDSISSIASVLDWFCYKIFLPRPKGPFAVSQLFNEDLPKTVGGLLRRLSYKSICEILRGHPIHANSLKRGCRGAGLHRRAGEGAAWQEILSLGADSNSKCRHMNTDTNTCTNTDTNTRTNIDTNIDTNAHTRGGAACLVENFLFVQIPIAKL